MRLLVTLLAAATLSGQEVWNFNRLDQLGGHKTSVMGQPRVIDTENGSAIEFDGVDDALFVDFHPLAGAETFTWEVIFRPDPNGPPEQRFFHLQENGTQTRMLLETRLIGDKWCLDSFVLTPAGALAILDRNKLHPTGRWHHVAMVYDGKELRHYINHKLDGSGPLKFTPQGAGRTSVGVRINLRDYFKGAIRTARMTKRALPVSEFLPQP